MNPSRSWGARDGFSERSPSQALQSGTFRTPIHSPVGADRMPIGAPSPDNLGHCDDACCDLIVVRSKGPPSLLAQDYVTNVPFTHFVISRQLSFAQFSATLSQAVARNGSKISGYQRPNSSELMHLLCAVSNRESGKGASVTLIPRVRPTIASESSGSVLWLSSCCRDFAGESTRPGSSPNIDTRRGG